MNLLAESDIAVAETAELWAQWQACPGDPGVLEALVNAHLDWVHAEVQRVGRRIPSHVDKDELFTSGLEALYESLRNFNQSLGNSFAGFARKRILGAILDRLRGLDGVPRSARRATKVLAGATREFRNRVGRTPCQAELADELRISGEALQRMEMQANSAERLSLDANIGGGSGEDGSASRSLLSSMSVHDNPLERMIDGETRDAIVIALERLPERERAILVLHYYEGIRFNEIAAAMEVSEARISQMHSMALQRVRGCLTRRS